MISSGIIVINSVRSGGSSRRSGSGIRGGGAGAVIAPILNVNLHAPRAETRRWVHLQDVYI